MGSGARREGRGRGPSAKGVSRPSYHSKDQSRIEVEEDKKSVRLRSLGMD